MDSDAKVLELGRVALRMDPFERTTTRGGLHTTCKWCDFVSTPEDKDPDRHTLDCPWNQATVARHQELKS